MSDYGKLFLRAVVDAISKVPNIYFNCSNANQAVAEQIMEQCHQYTKKPSIKKRPSPGLLLRTLSSTA